ncbi:MAG: sulfatase [Puniceicoccaceae bacterium]
MLSWRWLLFFTVLLLGGIWTGFAVAEGSRPNVVFIICDDLNDYVGHLGGHPQALTPHIDTLAETGSSFIRAYSNNPICAPSRASFLTGIYPHTSGNFGFKRWYENDVLINSKTMMEHFADNGYHVAGAGKVMHHYRASVWPEFGTRGNAGPFPWDGTEAVGHPSVPEPFRSVGLRDGSFGTLADVPFAGEAGKGWSYSPSGYSPFYYNTEEDRSLLYDEVNAQWAADKIAGYATEQAGNPNAAPFFLTVGFMRPHTPMFAPQKYFDMFPLESLQLPVILPADAEDTHFRDIYPDTVKGLAYYTKLSESYPTIEEGLRRFTQAYLACTAFVDDQIGVVLDALDAHGLADNTIVILTSDHGWNLGEKEYLFKNSPWEESDRVPLLIRAPGVSQSGGRPAAPVSLIDLYPTLVDLRGLEGDTRKNGSGRPLDGFSLRPFLGNPENRDWAGPDVALTMLQHVSDPRNPQPAEAGTNPLYQNYSLRSEDFRYIRYNDGVEELYDHRTDPYEWENLAGDVSHTTTLEAFREKLAAFLPDVAPTELGEILSINIAFGPEGNTAIDGLETFGVPSLGTVVGNWNNITAEPGDLIWANGGMSSVTFSLSNPNEFSYYGAGYINTPLNYGPDHYLGTPDEPGTSLTLFNLNANFPHGYRAIAYMTGFVANTGGSITDGATAYYYQTLNPRPETFTVDDLMETTVTEDPGEGLAPFAQYAVFGGVNEPLKFDRVTFRVDALYGGGVGLGGIQLMAAEVPSVSWAGYEVNPEGYADTGRGFIGWLWVGKDGAGLASWRYSVSLGEWVYLPEVYISPGAGAWLYTFETGSLSPVDQRDNWFFSSTLQTWIYSTSSSITSGPGWIYLMDLSS